jgi:hypothetical protein
VTKLSRHPQILDTRGYGTHDETDNSVTELLHSKTLRERFSQGPMATNSGVKMPRGVVGCQARFFEELGQ